MSARRSERLVGRMVLAASHLANRHGLYLGPRSARVHVAIYRRTAGRIGGRLPGFPDAKIVLLDHTGARTGTRRTTPLIHARRGDAIIVAASKAGQPANPAWLHNLLAHPRTTVQLGGDVIAVRARVADAEERAELWAVLNTAYAGFADFQHLAGERQIPVVALEPTAP